MSAFWSRRLLAPGLGMAATLLMAFAGCGGQGERADDATVTIPDPVAGASSTAAATAAPSTEGTAAPAATAEAKPEASKPAETASTKAEGWGTLKGKVVFEGKPPEAPPLVKKGDTGVKDGDKCATSDIPSERLVVNPDTKGVRYAIVYIPRPTAVNKEAESAALAEPIEFDQKGCKFIPHVVAMMKGSKVNVKSGDPVGHNVRVSLINTKPNLSILPGASVPPIDVKVAENKPGEVVCDIHPWMKAWWMVTNNPYFAVTDAKGNYEIKNVPAGTQKVVVWQEAVNPGFVSSSASGDPVDIKAGDVTTKDFSFDASKVKAGK